MPEPDPAAPSLSPGEAPARNATILEVAAAVFASFLGIRKGKAMRKDAVTIKPQQVVIVGVVLAAIFVVSLLLLVRVIIHAAGA